MPATLNIQPVGYDPSILRPQDSVRAAFNAWLSHFDYTTGSYDINVSYGKIPGGIESSVGYKGDTYVQVGSSAGKAVVQPVFGLNVTGRNGTTPATPALTFDINQVGLGGAQFSNLLREFEHALGARSSRGTAPAMPAPPAATTVFNLNVAGTENPAQTRPPSLPLFFQGPNAVAAYQAAGGIGPLLLSNVDGSILAAAVNTVNASPFFAGA